MYSKGYILKWFAWIEAITLTAAFMVVGYKFDLLPILILGGVSSLFLWSWTFFAILNLLINSLNKTKLPKWAKLSIGYPLALIIPTLALTITGVSLYGFIKAS